MFLIFILFFSFSSFSFLFSFFSASVLCFSSVFSCFVPLQLPPDMQCNTFNINWLVCVCMMRCVHVNMHIKCTIYFMSFVCACVCVWIVCTFLFLLFLRSPLLLMLLKKNENVMFGIYKKKSFLFLVRVCGAGNGKKSMPSINHKNVRHVCIIRLIALHVHAGAK